MVLPTGVVTFLFTDIEGSTKLFRELGDAYVEVLEEHNRRMRGAISRHGGVEVRTEGDAFFVAFADPSAAIAACLDAQLALGSLDGVRVRMGVHTGGVNLFDTDYVGLSVHEAARIAGAAHGGQVLVSDATRALVAALPDGAGFQDLGLHALKDFSEPRRLFQLTHPSLGLAFPPPRTLSTPGHNLPSPPASFVGRTAELAHVQRLVLGDNRIVSLVGTGGIGKSRLAIEVGWSVLSWFTEGVWFVGLADAAGPRNLIPMICAALGVVDVPGTTLEESLRQRLSSGPIMLIADNLEHLPDAHPILQSLLDACPPLTVLATSRERLHLPDEVPVAVEPLTLPSDPDHLDESDAARLFIERARAMDPGFDADGATGAAVVDICRRLDGVPLALELAAARVFDMPVTDLAARLGSALEVLTEGEVDLPTRQQTLRATLAWSYDLLKPAAQELLASLSVFAGGAMTSAVEAVHPASDVAGTLEALADANMVRHGATRWWMLETVRQFAAERLEESGSAPSRYAAHVDWALLLASEASPRLTGPDQVQWLDMLEVESANLDAAMGRAEPAVRLAIAARLIRFWSARGHWTHGRAMLDRALTTEDGDPVDRAEALMGAGHLAVRQLDEAAALRFLTEGAQLAEANGLLVTAAHCHNQLAELARQNGNTVSAATEKRLALRLARGSGDLRTVAVMLGDLGASLLRDGDPEGALPFLREAQALHRTWSSPTDVAQVLFNLARAELASGDLDAARTAAAEGMAVAAPLTDDRTLAAGQDVVARIEFALGDVAGASAIWREAFARSERSGDLHVALQIVVGLAAAAPGLPVVVELLARARDMAWAGGHDDLADELGEMISASEKAG